METADAIVFREGSLLLIQRGKEPYKGSWCFPGGHIEEGEHPKDAALRELQEETGLIGSDPQLVGVYGPDARDPRGQYTTHAYVLHYSGGEVLAGDDAASVCWALYHPETGVVYHPDTREPLTLGFDHGDILKDALRCRRP